MAMKCSYCDAVARSNLSLADQKWMAVVANVRDKKTKEGYRFHGRACPDHISNLRDELDAFLSKHAPIIKEA